MVFSNQELLSLLRAPTTFATRKDDLLKSFDLTTNLQEKNEHLSARNKRVAIIPCAGHGSRMNSNLPKALTPIQGVPCIAHTVNQLQEWYSHFIIPINHGLSSLFMDHLTPHLKQTKLKPIHLTYSEMTPGHGDGDAILHALQSLPIDFMGEIVIIWGDAKICDLTIIPFCLKLLDQLYHDISIIIPTVLEEKPYVALLRDEAGKVCDVKFERRGEITYNKEHDLSLFFGDFQIIKKYLLEYSIPLKKLGGGYSTPNQELNFLDLVHFIYVNNYKEVISPCIGTANSVLSFNTPNEVLLIEHFLNDSSSQKNIIHR